jgi:hypothetical protein
MFDKLRKQLTDEMSGHRIGVLSASGELGPQALPVQYRLQGLELLCLLPGEPAPADRYIAIRIRPSRNDLIDQASGWGARDTLDLE